MFTTKRVPSESFKRQWFIILLLPILTSAAAESNEITAPHFNGSQTCASSSCHGGAAEHNNQHTLWRKSDFHTRAYATLTTARSARLAEVLNLPAATASDRCTVCHAPAATLPESHRPKDAVFDGVSCESCHGPSEPWLRSHTRPDLSHADRVARGMQDLRNPYARANACVACHQTVPPDIAAAGHPELIFELDGQGASQPRHWREHNDHGQLWAVGQAAALREMAWQLASGTKTNETPKIRVEALAWLLGKVQAVDSALPKIERATPEVLKASADAFGKIASTNWESADSIVAFKVLAGTAGEFRDAKTRTVIHARRAERLVLALDRLALALEPEKRKRVEPTLNKLFDLAQNIPEFNPSKFAEALEALARE